MALAIETDAKKRQGVELVADRPSGRVWEGLPASDTELLADKWPTGTNDAPVHVARCWRNAVEVGCIVFGGVPVSMVTAYTDAHN